MLSALLLTVTAPWWDSFPTTARTSDFELARRLCVDIADLGEAAPNVAVRLRLPGHAQATLAARAYIEGAPMRPIGVHEVEGGLSLGSLTVPRYASVAIDGWRFPR